jgi:SAM-dependent methyltransferase
LTQQVAAAEIAVVGVDRSYSQAAATLQGGTIAVQADGQALPFAAGSFSAVLSNAALHWMRDQVRVLADVRRILGQEGRFVAEMGAGGNIDAIRSELYALLRAYGVDPEPRDPWFFPTPDEYRALLEQAGFAVLEMASWARPTPLPTGIDGWLQTFAGPFLNDLEPGTRVEMLNELQRLLASKLRTVDGRWIADYVRLRFVARAL